jgi:hypothetical protein
VISTHISTDRHMIRHKEKDDEAGGEGLGRLQTRKRLWRDSSGAVVAKRRPEHEKKRSNSSSSSKTAQSHMRATESSVGNGSSYQGNEPLSPPKSLQDHRPVEDDIMDHSQIPHTAAANDDMWPMPSSVDEASLSSQAQPIESFDFLNNASWGSHPSESNNTDLLYSDLFAPDTGNFSMALFFALADTSEASSFNMPFTTVNYYNWLFGSESWPANGYDGLNPIGHSKFPGRPSMLAPFNHSTPSSASRGLSVSDASGEYNMNGQRYDYGIPFKASGATSEYSPPGSYTQEPPTPETSAANQILAMSQAAELSMAAALGYSNDPAPPVRSYVPCSPNPPAPTILNYSHDTFGRQNRPRKLPVVDENARLGVLNFVAQAHPKDPEGGEITTDHPLLCLETMQNYCDLYFSRFNVSYPLLHPATFSPADVDPLLLTSILLLGATYDDKESHLFAICIHDVMRAQIFASGAFNTRPTLWMLQTILLVECFGKSRAGQLQHDMSHLFHGLLIK